MGIIDETLDTLFGWMLPDEKDYEAGDSPLRDTTPNDGDEETTDTSGDCHGPY